MTSPQAAMDAVITWVDGADPQHRCKMANYLNTLKQRPDSADPTRFSDNGELDYAVASIRQYAPWIRTIYIVTDEQTPELVNSDQAGDGPAIKIVDHKEIFRGHEQYLPVFNSLSIEAMLWRIEGLSEDFIYLNDDMMFIRPVAPENFVRGEQYVVRGRWRKKRNRKWLYRLRKKLGHQSTAGKVSHRDTQEHSADAINDDRRYLDLPHCPVVMNRGFFRTFFTEHPNILNATLSHRFRHSQQVWAVSLFVHHSIAQGKAIIDKQLTTVYVKGDRYAEKRIESILQKADDDPDARFFCIQSLDKAPPKERKRLISWLDRKIPSARVAAEAEHP